MNAISKSLLLVSLSASALCALAMGPAMPHFSERATDGKVYSDRTIGSHGPVLVMFFEAGCPHTPHGIDAMNRLKKEIGNQVTLVGVVNLGIGQAKLFAARRSHCLMASVTAAFIVVTTSVPPEGATLTTLRSSPHPC